MYIVCLLSLLLLTVCIMYMHDYIHLVAWLGAGPTEKI